MPYYCTVPRCTSMAGKAKNVSFHQFPRDEELAKLWNRILKRGKPYTKYSKVCSLHFKPEDYTITSVGKNKGQWRTLRKDAIPSQNLPSESPVPYTRSSPGCWVPSQPAIDPMVQQQMAQAIYMQTMLAMQAAGASEGAPSEQPTQMPESTNPSPSSSSLSEIELLLRRDTDLPKEVTYKCHECSKCFKDPDVFIIHKRIHKNTTQVEKENFSTNIQDREETLRANPILANLLKSSMRLEPETSMSNILTVENQIMAALASNMEAYIRTLSSMLASQANTENNIEQSSDYEDETRQGADKYDEDMCDAKDETNDVSNNEINDCQDIEESKDEYKETHENQSENVDESMNDEFTDNHEATQNTYNNDDMSNDKIETREKLETQADAIGNENCNSSETTVIDELRQQDSLLNENHSDKDDDCSNAFQGSDGDQCTEDMTSDANVKAFIDEKSNDVDENITNDGELNPATECDTELIRIEIELET